MKKTAILIFVSFISFGTYAQFHLGLRGGISSSQVEINQTIEGLKLTTGDNSFGYHIGLFTQFIFKDKFVIMPEALFSSTAGQIDLSDGANFNEVWNLSFNRLDIPVTFGVKFLKIFRVSAGPYASVLLSADARYANIEEDVKDNYKDMLWGYQAGLGVDFWKLVVDVKYEGSFTSAHDKNASIPGGNGEKFNPDVRPNQWILSVGLRLF